MTIANVIDACALNAMYFSQLQDQMRMCAMKKDSEGA